MNDQPVPDWLLHEAIKADNTLGFLDAYEQLGQWFDAEEDLPLRHQFALEYLELTGVHPEQRHEFRGALEKIRRYELRARIDGLIVSFRQRLQSKLSGVGC